MAEAIVCYVAKKLGDLIVKEAQLLGGVGDQVRRMQETLMTIQDYLQDADSKRRRGDKRVESWLNDLRNVAYRIEDATDTFSVERGQSHSHIEKNVGDMNNNILQKNCCCSFFHKVKKMGCKAKDLLSLHKLGKELGNIHKELDEIFDRKDKFDIKPLQDDDLEGRGSDQQRQLALMTNRRAAYQDVDETEIVGLNTHKDNILQLLDRPQRRAVITIVGTGGLGKTTLARFVYDSVKADFMYHIMISVSQEFNLTDLLKRMSRNLTDSITKDQDDGYYINELKSLLKEKRYLIVLDDVWRVELWGQLKHALPDDQNGSRVLITSRSIDVAKSADSGMPPYKLDGLNNEESLDLLLKKALPYQEPNHEYPSGLLEIAKKLSNKCKGLPLALIVLGGILSTKDQTYHDWKNVFDTMDWFEEGKECMQAITMSYEDMPYNLKPYFLYLASFPEDYEISARHLLRMWVAEGFIPQKETTMEQTAEKYLNQLFQRSMIMVSSRYVNGSIKCFRVHDLVRELAMSEARKQNFVTVFPEAARGVVNNSRDTSGTRRTSLQCLDGIDNGREYLKWVGPNTRSLLWFSGWKNPPEWVMVESRVLRLRVVEIVCRSTIDLRAVDRLIHLKYLRVDSEALILPSDFCWGRLKNLETLDIKHTYAHGAKMKGLWTIGTLRHVKLPFGIVDGPPANADLRNLQSLYWVRIPETWCDNKNLLPRLNNLRKIELSLNNEKKVDRLARLLGTLPELLSLCITAPNIPKEVIYPSGLPNYENLQTLNLDGSWEYKGVETKLEARFFPPHLLKLSLRDSELVQDPMPELGKLKALKKLVLARNVRGWGKEMEMISPAGGFPVLQTLKLFNLRIKSLTIMEGAMPKLKHLRNFFSRHTFLNLPPEHSHLAN